jgi:hypothetical protein
VFRLIFSVFTEFFKFYEIQRIWHQANFHYPSNFQTLHGGQRVRAGKATQEAQGCQGQGAHAVAADHCRRPAHARFTLRTLPASPRRSRPTGQ